MNLTTKLEYIKAQVIAKHGCKGSCQECVRKHRFIDKLYEANIPVGYWFLNMSSFTGIETLKVFVEEYMGSIAVKYGEGKSILFSGSQGTGKTMSAICMLKAALKQGFSAYYITASDALSELTNYRNYETRLKLRESDFLVIDELDSRFFVSDSTKELFSGIYENIFRFRTHNQLPTIICTNETSGISGVFHGPVVQSIESLNKQYLEVYPVAGIDYRGLVEGAVKE